MFVDRMPTRFCTLVRCSAILSSLRLILDFQMRKTTMSISPSVWVWHRPCGALCGKGTGFHGSSSTTRQVRQPLPSSSRTRMTGALARLHTGGLSCGDSFRIHSTLSEQTWRVARLCEIRRQDFVSEHNLARLGNRYVELHLPCSGGTTTWARGEMMRRRKRCSGMSSKRGTSSSGSEMP